MRLLSRVSKAIAIVCVLLAFLFMTHSAIKYGLFLPNMDDWRYFSPGVMNWDEGFSPFTPINDTISAVPFLLDQIIFRAIGYDFRSARLLSFGWVALYLWLVLKISNLISDKVFASVSILLAIFALRVGGYWDYPTYIAYHQALPLIFCIGIIYLTAKRFFDDEKAKRFHLFGIAALAMFACLSYISGAVAVLALAGAYLLMASCSNAYKNSVLYTGVVLGIVGVLGFLFQFLMVSAVQGDLLSHSHARSNVFPNDSRFWFFAFGILAKSIGSDGVGFVVNFVVVPLIFVGIAGVAAFGLFKFCRFDKYEGEKEDGIAELICIPALFVLFGYVFVVSFGRGGFLPGGFDFREISIAKGRFHFWWVSALIPLLIFSIYPFFKNSIRSCVALSVISIYLIFQFIQYSTFDWNGRFLALAEVEEKGVECLEQKMSMQDTPVVCVDLHPSDIRREVKKYGGESNSWTEKLENGIKLEFIDAPFFDARPYGHLDENSEREALRFIKGWMPLDFSSADVSFYILTNKSITAPIKGRVYYVRRNDVVKALNRRDLVFSGFGLILNSTISVKCIYAKKGNEIYYPKEFSKQNCEE